MGRDARVCQTGLTYHVINRGNNREVIFVEQEDYTHYLNTVQRYKKKYGFKLFAFCLMTNHVHMLIKVEGDVSISRIMQSITIAHTRFYNYKYQRSGHVWQGRFMSPIVSEDDHLLTVMRYIEQNPLRARMVKDVGEYRWSSYLLNVREQESKMIDREVNLVFNRLGVDVKARIKRYREGMQEDIKKKELEAIQTTTRKSGNYVSSLFQEQFNKLLPNKKKRGRPKKVELIVNI